MLKFDAALQTILDGATSKLDWCNKLVSGLGSGLKIRCKRSAAANSDNVFDTGVEFYNASILGAPVTNAGSIVKFGNVFNATVQTIADLSIGSSVLRIEGAEHWMEGTLGLTNSSCDFKLTSSPTAVTGIAFSSISISPPRSLPSGTGSLAPALDADVPVSVELWDWSNASNPVLVGTAPIDTRKEDFVYQDAEMAAEMGDVRITQSSKTIIFGQFEFGVTMFTIRGDLNLDVPGTPVHQVVVAHKPYGTWPSYPLADTLRIDRDTAYPQPYKLIIRKAGGVILKTIEMRDGLPVNDPSLSQWWGSSINKPLRPHFECGQWHFWQSARLKYSSNALKYFPGVTSQSMRPSLAKSGISSNATVIFETFTYQWNSTLHWYAAPQWPMRWTNTEFDAENDAGDTFDDPYLYNIRTYHADEGHLARLVGWDIEPGSISLHDWYCAPGGPRHDRSALPTPLVRYFTDPNGVRLKGNVPHRRMLDCYNHGYFHHSHHMLMPDVKNFGMLPKEFFRDGTCTFMNAYYGQGPFTPLNRTVNLNTVPNGGPRPKPIRDGHVGLFNNWSLDDNHSYSTPGLAAIFCNSPAHAVSSTLRLYAHVMAQLGGAGPRSGARGNFMTRVMAWRFHQLSVAWKIATNHSMGMDRETVEQRFQMELESIYDNVYVPAIINQSTDRDLVGIRQFGQPMILEYGTNQNGLAGKKWLRGVTDSKAGYFAGVFSLMRQTGCWAAMRARSTKCDTVLRFMVDCMDKDTLASLYWTKGRYEKNFVYSDRVPSTSNDPTTDTAPDPVVYADFAEWVQKNPATGLETLMTDVNGVATAANMDATTGLRLQWAFVRRDYFPEIPHPMDGSTDMVLSVCNMAKTWLDNLDTKIKAIPSQFSQMGNDMIYYYPPHGVYLQPTTLGPF